MASRRAQQQAKRRARAKAIARALLLLAALLSCLATLAWIGEVLAVHVGTHIMATAEGEDGDAAREAGITELLFDEPIVIALPQLPRKFDPLDDMERWAGRISDDLIFEGLVRRSGDRYPWVEPAIADRCVVDRDYAVTMVSCHIPKGIRFHDGRELSMDDVLYSLRVWQVEGHEGTRIRHGLEHLHRVEVGDGPADGRDYGRWVKLRFAKPEPLALEAIASIKIVPADRHRSRSLAFSQAPIGTGPMRVTTLETDRIVLERFDGYRDPQHRARARKIVFQAINDGAAALTALRRGKVHIVAEMAQAHIPVELGKPGMAARVRAHLLSPASYDLLLWNVGKGVTADADLRAALHEAIPFARIARDVYGSASMPVWGPVDMRGPDEIDLLQLANIKLGEAVRGGLMPMPNRERDTRGAARAVRNLDALGWRLRPDGSRTRTPSPRVRVPRARGSEGVKTTGTLRVSLTWNGDPGRAQQLSEIIRDAWAQIGVGSIDAVNSWRFMLTLLSRGDFRVVLLHFGSHSDEDLAYMFHSRGSMNLAQVADEQLDAQLDAYRHAVDRTQRDIAKQSIGLRLADLHVVTVLHAPTQVMLSARRLQGLEFVDDMPRLDQLVLGSEAIDWMEQVLAGSKDPADGFCYTCQ